MVCSTESKRSQFYFLSTSTEDLNINYVNGDKSCSFRKLKEQSRVWYILTKKHNPTIQKMPPFMEALLTGYKTQGIY